MVRQKNERLDIEVLQIDLAAAILNVESDDNIAHKAERQNYCIWFGTDV